MREREPFQPDDLEELHTELFSRADRVVPMRDIYKGDTAPMVIGLRHDVDDNETRRSFDTALRMAEWEFEHGYSSTYFLLHGSYYWGEEMLCQVPKFEELGHEVGIHVNALAESLKTGREPSRILASAIAELRNAGVRVCGSVAHGDQLCHQAKFVNDEMFQETPRVALGAPDRVLTHGKEQRRIEPLSRQIYGLEYDANWLPRGDYISDSGGHWNPRPDSFHLACQHLGQAGQLHILIHPDWWGQAFAPTKVTA